MEAKRIEQLVNLIPEDSEYFNSFSGISTFDESDAMQSLNKFIICYKDLQFGYHFVLSFSKTKKKLPSSVSEYYIKQAYNFENGLKCDPNVKRAYMYYHPSNRYFKDLIEGFLLVDDITTAEIAKSTGIPEPTIKAYEQLFFNILDRKKEAAFIASVVYPETRLVELQENYYKNESNNMLLKRSAYNNGPDDLMYMAGLKTGHLRGAGTEMAAKLEDSIMANGYYLARNGFLNQRYSTGVNNAKMLITASKQGGQSAENDDYEGVGSLGSHFIDEYMKLNKERVSQQIEMRKMMNSDVNE